VLKILSIADGKPGPRVIRIEGKLIGPWVPELKKFCESMLTRGEGFSLDCENLIFADAEGIALMRTLQHRQVPLLKCSAFMNLQLNRYFQSTRVLMANRKKNRGRG
jgi:hypothetical protein